MKLFWPSDQIYMWLHLSNWKSAYSYDTYRLCPQIWSLAIEEQFYLVWPFVILLCSDTLLLYILPVLMASSFGSRNLGSVQAFNAAHKTFIYNLTPFRIEPLMAGAFIALMGRRGVRLNPIYLAIPGLIILASVLCAAQSMAFNSGPMTRFGYSGLELIFGAVVVVAVQGCSFLRWRVWQEFGKYSYGIYLLHLFVARLLSLLSHKLRYHSSVVVFVVGASVSYLVARVSWVFIETPFLRMKDRISSARSSH
jgi:peptidoglycan/LPS O-acetylase OafA/YrhL